MMVDGPCTVYQASTELYPIVSLFDFVCDAYCTLSIRCVRVVVECRPAHTRADLYESIQNSIRTMLRKSH